MDGEALRRHCFEHGPAYPLAKRVAIVDELPRTGAGEIDRLAIAGRFRALCAEPTEILDGREPGCVRGSKGSAAWAISTTR